MKISAEADVKFCLLSTREPKQDFGVCCCSKEGTNFIYVTAWCPGKPVWLIEVVLFSVASFTSEQSKLQVTNNGIARSSLKQT